MMFTKKEIFSIPNILCYFRILLLPVFLWAYFDLQSDKGHLVAAGVLVLSSLSDFLDGFIARKYHMITELGKLIDPVADKLTQFVVACTLMYTYPAYALLVAIIVLKDGMLLFVGYYIYRKKDKHLSQAQMPGKVATAVFFVVSIILVAFYIPRTLLSSVLIYSTLVLMIIAMIYYGHSNGDLCLKYFAQTMQECFPKDSILGRYGGDEFVAYLKNVKPETVYACMESFQKKISHFTLSTGEVVELSASAGGVIFPEQGEDFVSLCKNADAVLYDIKQNGKAAFKMK